MGRRAGGGGVPVASKGGVPYITGGLFGGTPAPELPAMKAWS